MQRDPSPARCCAARNVTPLAIPLRPASMHVTCSLAGVPHTASAAAVPSAWPRSVLEERAMLFRSKSKAGAGADATASPRKYSADEAMGRAGAAAALLVPALKFRTLPRMGSSIRVMTDQSEAADFFAKGQLLGLTVNVQIPYTQVGCEKSGKIFTLYVVQVNLPPPADAPAATPTKNWEVKKRYSDFVELDKRLRLALAKKERLAPLPPKRFLNSFDDTVITERKRGFAEFLQSSLNLVTDESAVLLATFLELPGTKASTAAAATASDQQQHPQQQQQASGLRRSDSTAIKTQTVEGETHHGYLYKRGGLYQNKPFKLAFCVLRFADAEFCYYRTSRPQLLGTLKLKGQVGARVTPLQLGELGVPEEGWGFSLWTPERELIMYTETLEDRASWVAALNQVISAVKATAQTDEEEDSGTGSGISTRSPATTPSIVVGGDNARKLHPPATTTSAPPVVIPPPKKDNSTSTKEPTSRTRRSSKTGTPVELAERELASISRIRENWLIDWEDIQIGEKIGGGAFGTVYVGKAWGSIVAVKQLNTSGSVTPELKLALEKEVGVLSKLRHPNVVLYIGASFTLTNCCMVTEWCGRGSLFDLLKKTTLQMRSGLMLKIALDIARGMAYLHSRREQVIHRDLKSLNVLITSNFEAKVADFGLTVMREATTKLKLRSESAVMLRDQGAAARMESGSFMSSSGADFFGTEGTAQWMAPEVMEGARYNHKVDVYSFGILLTELLTRKFPFKDLYPSFDFVDAVLDRAERPTIPAYTYVSPDEINNTSSSSAPAANSNAANNEDEEMEEPTEGVAVVTRQGHSVHPTELGKLVMVCTNRDPMKRPDFLQVILTLEGLLSNSTEVLLRDFDLPRIRERIEQGDLEDVAEATHDLALLLGEADADFSTRQVLRAFFKRSTVEICSSRVAYGKASWCVDRGGEYEQVEFDEATRVNLVVCMWKLVDLDAGRDEFVSCIRTDAIAAVVDMFLSPALIEPGIDACGNLLNAIKLNSGNAKKAAACDDIMDKAIDALVNGPAHGKQQHEDTTVRRRSLVVSDREKLLWRCQTFNVLPAKYQKKANNTLVSATVDEVKRLEAEIRTLEKALVGKRKALSSAIESSVSKDVGKV